MIGILVDQNIEGQAALLWSTMQTEGWLDLVSMRFSSFNDIGLTRNSTDRVIWHAAQSHQMLLLTANRNMQGEDSLEQTIRDDNQATSLPVITISDVDRIAEATYRQRCATRLAEIVIYLNDNLGAGRLFIP